jgi:hypothetical protein
LKREKLFVKDLPGYNWLRRFYGDGHYELLAADGENDFAVSMAKNKKYQN